LKNINIAAPAIAGIHAFNGFLNIAKLLDDEKKREWPAATTLVRLFCHRLYHAVAEIGIAREKFQDLLEFRGSAPLCGPRSTIPLLNE
jgi:hypothetical protein